MQTWMEKRKKQVNEIPHNNSDEICGMREMM